MRLLFIFIIISGLAYCDKAKEVPVSKKGTLRFMIGDVSILHAGTKSAAKKEDTISEGDSILTGEKSVAIVDFAENAGSVEIQQNSEFIVSKFNEKEQELISKSGNFWLNAKKLKKDTNFQVIMPTSVAGIRGTKIYSFEMKEAGITGVCHCQGGVDFKENSSNYSGSHDSDFLVMTKAGKTIVLTPKDFEQIGITSDGSHNHSSIEDSPLGKKADENSMTRKKINAFMIEKFEEK